MKSRTNSSLVGILLILGSQAFLPTGNAAEAEAPSEKLTLEIRINPVKNNHGTLNYTLYNQETSWQKKDQGCRSGSLAASEGEVHLTLSDLEPGIYAFTVYHDENGNGKFDTNFVGQPEEMFGISNITRTLWSEPGWDEIRFELRPGQSNSIPILMKKQ